MIERTENWIERHSGWALMIFTWVALLVGFASGWASARAAVVTVDVHASRDGYARLHAEGGYLDGCTLADQGRCQLLSSRGKPTTRRVKVHKGRNTIRLKAFRWEDMAIEQYVATYRPFDPGVRHIPAAWPLVAARLNWVFVWGRVAGKTIEPKEIKL